MARRRKSTTRRNTKAYSLAGVWLTLGIFLGVGAMALAYTFYANHPPHHKVAKNPPETKVTKSEQEPRSKNQKYEFYTKLKDTEVEKPIGPNFKTEKKLKTENTKSTLKLKTNAKQKTSAHYIVQAGIYQDLKAADAQKATLTLQGFAPIIQTVQTNEGKIWYRVTLGPFPVESLALHQKKRLATYNVRGILILQRPNL